MAAKNAAFVAEKIAKAKIPVKNTSLYFHAYLNRRMYSVFKLGVVVAFNFRFASLTVDIDIMHVHLKTRFSDVKEYVNLGTSF
jgi:hypothetical protein